MSTTNRVIKSILLPVDLSPASENVIRFMEALKKLGPIRVYLQHVIEAKIIERPAAGFNVIDLINDLESKAREKLEEYKKRLEKAGFQPEIIEIEVGEPAEKIALAAQKLDVSMIIMGYKGRGFLKKRLLGSVTEEIVNACVKPTLVVKWVEHEKSFTVNPIIAALKLEGTLDEKVLAYATDLASRLGSKLVLFHVVGEKEDRRRVEEKLGELAGSIAKEGVNVEAIIWSGTPWIEIINAARVLQAGLVVIGNDECHEGLGIQDIIKDFLRGSTAENVLRRSEAPVLVVK